MSRIQNKAFDLKKCLAIIIYADGGEAIYDHPITADNLFH